VLTPEWKRVVSLGFYVLVGGGGLVLTFSPGANRAIKRFIDRNFYANRYDYRREWERVSRAITPTSRPEDICRQVDGLLKSVFDADRVAIPLKDERRGASQRAHRAPGPATPEIAEAVLPDNPLVQELDRLRAPLAFRALGHALSRITTRGAHR